MVSCEDVRAVLHVRGSVLAVCVLFRLLVSVPVQAALNGNWEGNVEDFIPSSFLYTADWGYGKRSDQWSYGNRNGPDKWRGLCTTGKKQSPVDLSESKAFPEDAEALVFFNYENPATLKVVNSGHTVSAGITENCPRAVAGGKLPGLYYLDSFHFHWKSEHTIDNKRFPLEAHFVHLRDKYKSIKDARGDPHGLAVIGVFFEAADADNEALTPLLEGVKKVAEGGGASADVAGFKLSSLLPPSEYIYRYDGSLTTPDCDEMVVWTVIDGAVKISNAQLLAFSEIKDSHKEVLKRNYRPVQRINDRTIHRYRAGACRHHLAVAAAAAALRLQSRSV